jgi:hypothetical protein
MQARMRKIVPKICGESRQLRAPSSLVFSTKLESLLAAIEVEARD